MEFIEGLLVGLIGRPILTLIKWFKWPFLGFGLYFNAISTYNTETGIMTSELTWFPFIVGFILFCIGMTVKKYDNISKEYYELIKEEL